MFCICRCCEADENIGQIARLCRDTRGGRAICFYAVYRAIKRFTNYLQRTNKFCLRNMTQSSIMLFVEQLYRAMTILRGEPYHHD